MEVSNLHTIPDGMINRSFDGGNYVNLSAKGNLMKGLIVNKWIEIWNMNLDRAFAADFEIFGEKAQNPNDAEIDFLLP